jgi:UDP:flavonoid glycosyltransferase YjiC (YdhE family)
MVPSPAGTAGALRNRPRVLVVAEAVTLAHVGRAVALIESLDPAEFDISFACDPRYDHLLPELHAKRLHIESLSSRDFLKRLARGSPVFDFQTLETYVKDDLRIIEQCSPDAIVGDMRLSLSVSARLAGVPYVAISNAYWSPFARQKIPAPDLPVAHWFGATLGQTLFDLVRPLAFAYHALPLNRVRRRHGLPQLRWDVRDVYTDADYVLYADIPELFPMGRLPPCHGFIGPLLWSPTVDLPDWWNELPADSPMIYVNLGSSGRGDLLPTVLQALEQFPVTILASTAGMPLPMRIPDNAFLAEYLPGNQLAARSKLVICNGGSPAASQALAAGTPLVGVCSNMDQLLNMQAVRKAGAGELLRAENTTSAMIEKTARRVLSERRFAVEAGRLSRSIRELTTVDRFHSFLKHAVASE